MDFQRQLDHLVYRGELLVETDVDLLAQAQEIAVLDMPAVFTQMESDRAGAGALGGERRLDRIGIVDAPRLAQRGDVIDIDAEPGHPQVRARPACRPIAAPISRASAAISAGSSPSIITRASISVPE